MYGLPLYLTASFLLVTSIVAHSQSLVIDAPEEGVELGLGWDSKRSVLVPNRCIQFAPIQEGGQELTLSLSEVTNSAELSKHLGVSASAMVHGLTGKASASAEFTKNTKIKSSAKNFAVKASVTNGIMFAGPYRAPSERRFAFSATEHRLVPKDTRAEPETNLMNDTLSLLPWVTKKFGPQPETDDTSSSWLWSENTDTEYEFNREAFRAYCGDSYVSAIYSGAELFSIISFESTNKDKSEKTKASIKASFGAVSGKANFAKDSDASSNLESMKMHFLQRGGAGGIIPTNREQIVSKLGRLAQEAAEAPQFFNIRVTPYASLPGWFKCNGQPCAMSSNHNDQSTIVNSYLHLVSFHRDLQDVVNDFHFKSADKRQYASCFSSDYYENLQDRVKKLIHLLEEIQRSVEGPLDWSYSDPRLQRLNKEITALNLGKPLRTFSVETGPLDYLRNSISMENLKIMLPPKSSAQVCDTAKAEAYQKAVIDQYIRPYNDRICNQNPADRECLSNEKLALLQSEVKTTAVKDIPGQGYLCSGLPDPNYRCLTIDKANNKVMLTNLREQAAVVTFKTNVNNQLTASLSFNDDSAIYDLVFGANVKRGKFNFKQIQAVARADKDTPVAKAISWTDLPVKGRVGAHILRGKSNKHCLVTYSNEKRLLAHPYPRSCDVRGKSIPHYSWVLVGTSDEDLLPE